MSEQKTSFMAELDQWTTETVIHPLEFGDPDDVPGARSWEQIVEEVKHAIREKVLESYKNGCRAGAGHVRKELQQPASKPAGRAALR